ncbi:MAG: DUF502 domain-containing protein [Polyangiaceae bacterium]
MRLRKIIGYFVRGALVTAPFALTLYLILTVLGVLDRVLPIGIPGLGLLVSLTVITLIGVFTSNVVGRGVLDATERLLTRVPLLKLVYSSIKDLIGAFVGDRKTFDRPVSVRLSQDSDVRLLGFVTREDLRALSLPGHVAVYLPQSYNFAGNLIVVPAARVEALSVPSGELMTFIVSGGVSGLGVGQSLLPPPPR